MSCVGAQYTRAQREPNARIVVLMEIDELVGILRKSLDEAEPALRALKPEGAS